MWHPREDEGQIPIAGVWCVWVCDRESRAHWRKNHIPGDEKHKIIFNTHYFAN